MYYGMGLISRERHAWQAASSGGVALIFTISSYLLITACCHVRDQFYGVRNVGQCFVFCVYK